MTHIGNYVRCIPVVTPSGRYENERILVYASVQVIDIRCIQSHYNHNLSSHLEQSMLRTAHTNSFRLKLLQSAALNAGHLGEYR